MPIDKSAVVNRLRQFIISKNWKNKDLADALGISQSSLQSNYLSGKSLLGAELLYKLEELGCDIIWLLSGKDSRTVECEKRVKELEREIEKRDERIKKLLIRLGEQIESEEEKEAREKEEDRISKKFKLIDDL